ncbi:CDP-glucose 4,6-dehydratase [Endomicrobium proavitum]|uniref:CDP-glucose 4,6-dehydratase n=1 Tax=Endomicrobium proavitum TaxID=1408281 RepID=A0A0G3WMC4_9BACT|nr:CDP-glucose 4,6-dehydratase [Endomicrobium proavitum]AKL98634.1 CDP-glucose 4,6-dehydratase [Endomicrobium proavitum]
MDFSIYKGKKVFITGHTGFKGSWLALWLSSLGAEVCGYALAPNTTPALFNILKLKKKIRHIKADVRNFKKLKKELCSFNPDIIFHLAAQPLVRLSYKDPLDTYSTNVLGTANVFEAARLCKNVKAIVNVTTDKCYKNKEQNYAYKETDELGGYDPYSNSKACCELITSSYRDSFFNPKDFGVKHNAALASARAGNVIGGGDYSLDRLLPDFVKAIQNNQEIVLRNPNAVRPWQFVLEPLSGYLMLGKKLLEENVKFASAYNFGPYDNSIITVEEVVKTAISAYGKGKYSIDKGAHPHEATLLKLNIAKAEKELNWKPIYEVKEAIEKTINWYKAYSNGKDMTAFSLKQISDYIK